MKNLLKPVFVIAFAMLVSGNIFAQQKFAHINRTELIQSMPEFKTSGEKLEAYGKELQSSFEEVQVEYNKRLDDFQKNQETWTDEKKEVKTQELISIQRRLEEQRTSIQESYGKKEEELFMPVLKKASDAINKVAKAGGYIYVFESSAVHYVDDTQSTNLLPAVKKELGIN
ncbi:MAG: OmpH family outer membrane protein [Prevotellaceae bacterium]|jgi:outer membrane protein|nr:OmpH family outer membrane protein [Prevotellaceae bacterium]